MGTIQNMIRRCPQHGYQDYFQIQLFYNGLNGQIRTIVDATASGTLLLKIAIEAHRLLEEMSANNCQWLGERSMAKKAASIHEVDPIVNLLAQVFARKETAMVATTSYMVEGFGFEQ